MKDFFKNIYFLVILVLIILLLIQRSCYSPNILSPEVKIERDTVIIYDTITIEKSIYIPQIITKTIVDIDTFQTPIDTLEILKDYYSINYYIDTFKIDTIGNIIIKDTITQNSILNRSIISNLIIPQSTITNTIYTNKREFYWGIKLNGNSHQLSYIGAELLYKNKKKQAYSIGIGFNPEFQPILSGGIYWKIGK